MTQRQNEHSDACGCCEGIEKLTPLPTANRPGLDALTYRVGTHSAFLETMQARLTDLCLEMEGDGEGEEGRRVCPLRALTTREASDPAIALLDAWATVGDVLTFYQERIANEGYLRTATERRSILELARLIGYELRPGVAASVYLAFTLEDGKRVEIPAGTGARSKPGPGESPQMFETSEPLEARAVWNALKPRMSRPQYVTRATLAAADSLIHFEGTATNLGPNDPLLFDFEAGEPVVCFVQGVDVQQAEDRTDVILQAPVGGGQALIVRAADARRREIRQTAREYLNLEDYEVSLDSAMAQRVIRALEEIDATLTLEEDPEVVESALDAALSSLRKEHRTAEKYGYGNLEPWVGELVERLERHKAELARIRADGAGTRMSAARPDRRREGEGDNPGKPNDPTGLGDLIAPLLKPVSRQPANALQLQRTIQQTFGAGTDFAPHLLTAVKPQLRETLYRAWGSARVTAPSALKTVEVLRLKASPFGHSAPLKPIYDDQGRIVGYEEWPLAGTVAIGVRLFWGRFTTGVAMLHAEHLTTTSVSFSIKRGAETKSILVPLEEGDVTLDGETIRTTFIRDTAEGPIEEVQFEFVELERAIRLKEQAPGIAVTIDNDPERVVTPGQTLRYAIGGRKVEIAFGDTLSISDESPAPVASALWKVIALDAEYDQITPGGWVVIERPGWTEPRIFRVVEARTISRADYGITGKVTQLTLDGNWLGAGDTSLAVLRETTIYAAGEELALAEAPIEDDVAGQGIELDALYDGLEAGRWVIVSGERTDIEGTGGVRAGELVMLASVTQGVHTITTEAGDRIDLPGDTIHTTIQFANDLSYTYKRDTVTIYGNVVKATHGETREEVLGSGDGSQARQQFELKKSPLTHLAAPTPSGAESTLEVRVNDVRWHEADNLFELEPLDRGYVTRTDDEDTVAVIFGDGTHGARLPTGVENVRAVYRKGIGKPGNVDAEQISLLASRPLGVKGVLNPLPASGGADREDRDQARRNAPLAVMALDRLVSVRDYADFARTFAGIGKASAVELSDGRREVVHLTIAGADDVPIDPTSDLYQNLRRALLEFGDPYQPLQIDVRELKLLVIGARVRLLPDYAWEFVAPEIRATLLDTFSFQRRELGQDVVRGEVISAIQHVPGVAYVDLDILDSVREDVTPDELETLVDALTGEEQPRRRVAANKARINRSAISPDERIQPAQIAYLSPDVPDTLILTVL